MDTVTDKAHGAIDSVSEMAHSAQVRTQQSKDQTGSYISEKAGVVKEKACETAEAAKQKASETAEAAKKKESETAQAAKEKASQIAESGKETAQVGKEKTGGIVQQTGEQVISLAQGAVDAVKNTFGMNDTANPK